MAVNATVYKTQFEKLDSINNQKKHVKDQVHELNKMVWNYSIPQVFNEAQGYYKYLSDASTMYKPMNPPISTQNNDKELVLKPWF